MRVLVIDNFDSFTYNLVQCLGSLGSLPVVRRNDEITPQGVLDLAPDRVLISPGPGRPEDAGNSPAIVRAVAGRIPLLGVCLGHQCIGQVFGCKIVRAHPMHGKVSQIEHDGRGIFAGLRGPIQVARYHSLAIDQATVGADLQVTARTHDGIVMGIRHKRLPIEGVQFHPESFLTPAGKLMIRNFLAETWAQCAA